MGTFSIWHWLIVLVVVVLVFGTKKLGSLGSDLGGAVKGFRKAMGEGEADDDDSKQIKQPDAEFSEASEQRETEHKKAS